MEKIIKKKLDLSLLRKLIKIRSLSCDQKKCLKALKLIEDKLIKQNIPCLINQNNGFYYLVAGNLNEANFLFLSHIDVIDAENEQFMLKNDGDKFYGRGVLDMKGPLISTLIAFIRLWKNNFRNFLFVITSDEEIGGFNGSNFLTQSTFSKIKAALIPDSIGEELVVIQKAPYHIKINSLGKSSHGSKPWNGINALYNISQCCIDLVKKIDKNMPDKTSAAITQISGGKSTNTIPGEAIATLDIRILRQSEVKKIIEIIDQVTKKWKCTWENIDEPFFFELSKKNSIFNKWSQIYKKINNVNLKTKIESGASDARFLWHFLKVPVIVTSVVGGGAHSKEEWVNIKSLEKLTKTIESFGEKIN